MNDIKLGGRRAGTTERRKRPTNQPAHIATKEDSKSSRSGANSTDLLQSTPGWSCVTGNGAGARRRVGSNPRTENDFRRTPLHPDELDAAAPQSYSVAATGSTGLPNERGREYAQQARTTQVVC